MPGGGHVFWDEGAPAGTWRQTVRSVADSLSRERPVIFLCHGAEEEAAAREHFGDYPRVQPRSVAEYFDTIAGAAGCLCNRMHACMAFRALGIPAVAVGRDTRILMTHLVDATCLCTETTDATALLKALEEALAATAQLRRTMQRTRHEVMDAYTTIIRRELNV